MNALSPLESARLSWESSRGMLSRKDILEFVRSMYPGEVGPEDVLEAACLIDAWQWGQITFRLEPVFEKDQEETVEFGLSNLRVLVGFPKDEPAFEEAKEDDDLWGEWRSQIEQKSAEIEILKRSVSDLKLELHARRRDGSKFENERHEKTVALANAEKSLKKRTVMAFCFAGLAALEGLSFLAWAIL